jgi:hypothetical protein
MRLQHSTLMLCAGPGYQYLSSLIVSDVLQRKQPRIDDTKYGIGKEERRVCSASMLLGITSQIHPAPLILPRTGQGAQVSSLGRSYVGRRFLTQSAFRAESAATAALLRDEIFF